MREGGEERRKEEAKAKKREDSFQITANKASKKKHGKQNNRGETNKAGDRGYRAFLPLKE